MIDKVTVDRISRIQGSRVLVRTTTEWEMQAGVATYFKSILRPNFMIEEKFTAWCKSVREIQDFTCISALGI